MRKLLSALAAVVLAASFAPPLNAAPIFVPRAEQVQIGNVEQVRYRGHRHWRADRYWNHRYAYRSCGYYDRCYRYPRYGYRYPRYYDRGYYGGYRDYYGYRPRSGVSLYFHF